MSFADFDFQPTLIGPNLTVRPLTAEDFDALRAAAADPEIWAGHPAKNRHEPEAFRAYFDFLLATGSALVVTLTATGEIIGCTRYYVSPDAPASISIGFTFLARAFWGGATNRELKGLMLDHVFRARDHVWLHIDPTNIRSQKATRKLGAKEVGSARLDLGFGEGDQLRFRLTKEDWAAKGSGQA